MAESANLFCRQRKAGLSQRSSPRQKKLSTAAIDRGMVVRHIKPLIGSLRADKLRRADVQRMIDAIAAGATATVERTKPRGQARDWRDGNSFAHR